MMHHKHPHERMGLYLVFGFVVSILVLSKLFTPDTAPINSRLQAATKTVASASELIAALAAANPGDTIQISGTITGPIAIVKSGTQAAPITVKGGTIKGGSGNRMVEIRDSNWLVFDGITFDGVGFDSSVYVLNSDNNLFKNNIIQNGGGECFRLKAGSQHNSIIGNTVQSCGRTKWAPPTTKNGEGIYLGTVIAQLSNNIADAAKSNASDKSGYMANPDDTTFNYIANNIIRPGYPENTKGNECVDPKEGAGNNLIENNTCSGQLDKNSGGMESRGNHNIFRKNTYNSIICGAGIRLGSPDVTTEGIDTWIIQNTFNDYSSPDSICPASVSSASDLAAVHGAVKVMLPGQGYMCGNTLKSSGAKLADGTYASQIDATAFLGTCDQAKIDTYLSGKEFGVTGLIVTPTVPAGTCMSSAGTWQNQPIASQNNTFTADFTITTDTSPTDLVVGLSKNPATTFSDLAVVVRMNTTGYIDVRNGSIYDGIKNTITQYQANTPYDIELVVNTASHTFDAKIVLGNQIFSPLLSGTASFRTEQSTVTDLNYINIFRNTAATGTGTVCNININNGTSPTPTLVPTSTITPTLNPTTSCPFKAEGDADCKKDSLGLDIGLIDFNIWRAEKFGGCSASNLAGCGADEDYDGNPMDSNFNYTGSGNLPVQPDPIIDSIDFNIWRTGYFAHKNQTATPTPTNSPTPTVTPTSTPVTCTYPGQILDLSYWKLTLPIGSSGAATEILQPQLATYSIVPWFQKTGNCTGVQFRAHTSSTVTTASSSYPRSELREMSSNGQTLAAWSNTSGTHTMFIDQTITQVPFGKKHLVAGQVHDANNDILTIRIEYPNLYIAVGGNNIYTLDSNYTLGKRFTVKIVAASGKISVYYNGSAAPVYTLTQSISGSYFKAGAYTQSNCSTEQANGSSCSENNYGEVVIYSLSVTHQ